MRRMERASLRARSIMLTAGLAMVPPAVLLTASPAVATLPSALPAVSANVHIGYGWGNNAVDEVGNRVTTGWASSPVPVTGLAQDVIQVSAGEAMSVALHADGTVWTWGSNLDGNLGDGSSILKRSVPGKVPGLPRITQVSAGFAHVLARGADGSVWAWGLNSSGQLGDGKDPSSEASARTPVRVLLSGAVQVSAGGISSVAVGPNGEVWTWGSNSFGQLGNHSPLRFSATPVRALTPDHITQVAAGNRHVLALRLDGSVWAWGLNSNGQLGDGTFSTSSVPVRVDPRVSGITRIAAGAAQNLAVGATGVLWSWGANDDGQIGDGAEMDRSTPVAVAIPAPPTQVTAGQGFDLAVLPDGTLWGWGRLPTAPIDHPHALTPTRIAGTSDVVYVSAGTDTALIVMAVQPVEVPDLQYLQDDPAGDTSAYFLDAAGLTLGTVTVTDVLCQFRGEIIGQTPAAGTVVPGLTAVSVLLVDPDRCF
jgi:alpha-tubulin suppressor-like RCC1 family protein